MGTDTQVVFMLLEVDILQNDVASPGAASRGWMSWASRDPSVPDLVVGNLDVH
jgi:hypothetical protein